MDFKKVTAIIRQEVLEKVEDQLKALGVRGVSVTKVKGFGEYADFYERDWMVTHAQIDIFTDTAVAEQTAKTIIAAAHTGIPGDGVVAILPVEKLYHIRDQTEVLPNEG